jgi:hypothetical protein
MACSTVSKLVCWEYVCDVNKGTFEIYFNVLTHWDNWGANSISQRENRMNESCWSDPDEDVVEKALGKGLDYLLYTYTSIPCTTPKYRTRIHNSFAAPFPGLEIISAAIKGPRPLSF